MITRGLRFIAIATIPTIITKPIVNASKCSLWKRARNLIILEWVPTLGSTDEPTTNKGIKALLNTQFLSRAYSPTNSNMISQLIHQDHPTFEASLHISPLLVSISIWNSEHINRANPYKWQNSFETLCGPHLKKSCDILEHSYLVVISNPDVRYQYRLKQLIMLFRHSIETRRR